MEKFPRSANEDDIEKELDRIAKEIERDLNEDPDALKEIQDRERKKKSELDELYEDDEEEIEIDLGEVA